MDKQWQQLYVKERINLFDKVIEYLSGSVLKGFIKTQRSDTEGKGNIAYVHEVGGDIKTQVEHVTAGDPITHRQEIWQEVEDDTRLQHKTGCDQNKDKHLHRTDT